MKKVKLNSTSIMRKRIGLLTKRQFICAMIAIIVAAGAIFVGCRRGNFETDVNLNVERTTKPRPTDGSTPASHTINDNFYFAMDALLNCKSFIGESHGTSTAAGVEQQVKAYRVVDGDKVYKESLAYSNFKKVGVEMYVSGDNYVLRETSKLNSVDSVSWPASPYKITEDGFLGKFGAKPNTITSYALNDKSILPSSEYLGEENGVYKFRYDLDPVEATPSIRKEMRTMAGTKTLPNFQSASLTVSIDKDWNVLQTETNSVYEVDMLGGVTAHEHIIETFRYGEEPKIPDEEVFTPYLSAEATDPAPEAATAMDYLTNGFTDYLGGQRALSVTTGTGSDLGLSGRVAINVNLSADNILDELEVRAQIDSLSYGDAKLENLFVGFNGRNGGEVYLTAGDLRAKLGINDVTALVGKIQAALAPSGNAAGEDGEESESLLGELDFGSILDGAEPITQDGVTLVPLTLSLAGMDIDVKMYFTEGETISLDHIDATVKSEKFNAALKVAPAPEGDTVNPIPADCLDIMPAINGLLGDDLAPTLAIKAGDINATVRADLASGALDAALLGLKVKYVDNTAYIQYGDFKGKLAADDLTEITGKLLPIVKSIGGKLDNDKLTSIINSLSGMLNGGGADLGSLLPLIGYNGASDLGSIITALVNGLDTTRADGTLGISLTFGKIAATLSLTEGNGAYAFGGAEVKLGDTVIDITAADKTAIEAIETPLTDFHDITPILDIIGDDNKIKLDVEIGKTVIRAAVNLADLTADVNAGDLSARYADGKIYLSYKGLNAYIATADFGKVMERIKPIISKLAPKNITDALDNLGDLNIAGMLSGALKTITVTDDKNGTTTLSLSIEVPSLGTFDIAVSLPVVDGGYTLGGITVSGNVAKKDLTITATPSTEEVTPISEENIDKAANILPILDIIGDDNTIKLKITVGETTTLNAAVNLMDLTADVEAGELSARYADGKIYLSYKGLNAYIATADFSKVMGRIKPIISNLAPDMADTLNGLGKLDIAGMLGGALKTITVTDDKNGTTTLSLSIEVPSLGKFDIAVSLPVVNGGYTLGKITVSGNVADKPLTITATPSTEEVTAISKENIDKAANILPILDIIDENSTIKLKITIGETTTINAAVNLADLTADVNAGELLARYAEGKIYLSYKGLNAYIATADFSKVMDRLTPIISSLAPKNITDALDNLGTLDIAGMLGGALKTIAVKDDKNGTTTLSLSIEVPALGKFDIAVSLPVVGGGYTLGKITVSGTVADKPLTITATPSTEEVPTISDDNLAKAANILPILDIIGDDNTIKLKITVGETKINAAVNLADLTADVNAGDLLARYADGKIYLSYKGLNAYIATADFGSVMDRLTPILSSLAPNIADTLDNLGDLNIAGMLGGALKTITVTDDENGTTTLSLSIDVLSLGKFDIAVSLPVVGGGYTLGKITVSGTVADKPLTITATPSAQEVTPISEENLDKAADITGLLALIDGGNINLTAKIGGTDIGLTLDLNTMTLYAATSGLVAKVDLREKTALATYSGIGVKLNLSDITSILKALEPTITKLMKDSGTTLDATAKLGDLANKLDIAAILGQIEFAEGDNDTLSSNLEIDGITVTLTLSTAGKKLTFAGATVTLGGTKGETKGGTKIAVTPSKTAVTFDGLADEKYIDLKTVADVFAAPLNALVTAKTVTIKPSGTITLSDRTYEITGDSEIVIGNIDDVENLMLRVYIKAHAKYLNADGTVGEESDHTIKFIYKRNDGGKKSGYLYYDDSASKDAHFEAQFTLDNLNATLENLKTIYNHIPELQTALSKYIPVSEPDENGNVEFKLPEIDVKKLIHSLTLEGEKLTAGLNLSALMAALPDETVEVAITAENGAAEGETAAADTKKQLSLSIGKLSLGNIAISGLTAYASGTTDPRADAFDYTVDESVNDFSSINELTKALAVTTEYRHFNLSGNIDLNLLGKKYNGAISLEKLQIDVNKETGKTYFYAHIKRAEVKALGFVNAWSDKYGDLDLYFDGEAKMIYAIEHSHYVDLKDWFREKDSYEYKKYTLDYFTSNIMEVLSDLLNFGSLITDNLGKTSDAKGGRLHLDQLIKSYAHTYDNPNAEINEDNATKNSAGKFDITLNLGSLTNDVIKELPITIKHDAKFELTSINANLTIFSVITVKLDITHNRTPNDTGEYNIEQHSQSAVEQQAQKSEYVLVG